MAVAIPEINNVIVITWKTSLLALVNSSKALKAPSMIVFTNFLQMWYELCYAFATLRER
jgi:hypothetical protein